MQEVGKVPLPSKMYTKPVDVNQPHLFGHAPTSLKKTICYDPLEWTSFFDSMEKINGVVPLYIAGHTGHVFLCMHGAGHSALSFGALAKYMKDSYTVTAFDFRGHGDHHTDNDTDLSEETLIRDSIEVMKYVCAKFNEASIIIVGHSMGGSIATKATSRAL
jgi:protein phosphatase methylesterase 1